MAKTLKSQQVSQASSRAAINRIYRQDDLRERIAASNVLTQILKAESLLMDDTIELDSLQIARKAKALDSMHKRLAKILPDLKATEVIHRSDNPIDLGTLNPEAIAQMRQAVAQSLGLTERIVGGSSIGGQGGNGEAVPHKIITQSPRHEISDAELVPRDNVSQEGNV